MRFKNKLLSFLKENKFYLIYCIILFSCLSALISFVPFSGDDWAWGSKIGAERLHNWFKGYNGRYSGNLTVLALTRSNLLRSCTVAFTLTALCFLPMIFVKKKSPILLTFSTFVILSVPKPIFVQGIFWTAGFANYVPPILLIFIYLAMINGIFEKNAPQYSSKKNIAHSIIAFLIAFIGSMFVENVTIFIMTLAVFVIAYCYIKFKKIFSPHLTFLIGGILGTVAMFSNSVYSSLQEESDGYRVLPGQQENLLNTFISHSHSTALNIFVKGFVICIFLSLLCFALTFVCAKQETNKTKKRIIILSFGINAFCLIILLVRRVSPLWNILFKWLGFGNPYGVFLSLIALLYSLSILTTVILCVKDTVSLHRMLVPLFSVPVLVGPMLIINPFGPRVLAPAYLCLAIFTALLFDYTINVISFKATVKKAIALCLIAFSLTSVVFYSFVYLETLSYDKKRTEYIEKQLDMGYTEITVCNLPNLDYMQCADLTKPLWQTRYKIFHGIDTSVKFKIVSCEEFDKWCEEFDKINK